MPKTTIAIIIAISIIAAILTLFYFASRSIKSNKLLDLLNKRDPSKYQEAIDEYNGMNPDNEVFVQAFSKEGKDPNNISLYLDITRKRDKKPLFELVKNPGKEWREF